MSPFLQIKDLSKEFTSNGENYKVFSNVSLELEEGEFLCILGSSGCGKTTLLRCVGGFEQPSTGQVIINGKLVEKPGIHDSMVFQSFEQLFPWKTVLGNVLYPLQINHIGSNKKETVDIAMSYLDLVGLTQFKNYYPHQLSGGMKQRVAIARSLAQKPSVILMDEPFASLDADTRTSLQNELISIWSKSKITILFVTHSIIEAIALGSKFLVMGGNEDSVRMYMDNPVQGTPGRLRDPEDEGFSECWGQLKNLVRK